MPTPVGVARQCLADSAAAVLDDAVAVARRRSHAQTTSLHVVSALLALPASLLRESCSRARNSAYAPRLQFRALELCVGVALDRVSVSKSAAELPPVSNSLMAAIKRSQANQRRHPETFHLYQQQLNLNPQNSTSISTVKVEMKHFMMSILDDPIVSRVFGDAGFRTHEIKLAVINPLTMSRFSLSTTALPPPLFQCNLTDFEQSKRFHNFPFSNDPPKDQFDENSRRIGEILVKSTRRNPLLIGVYGSDACQDFTDCLKRGEAGVLPKEIDGLKVVSLEHEISELISGGLSEEMIELKFEQVDGMAKGCTEPGIIVNCGDFKTFVNAKSVDSVNCVVSKLKRLLTNHGAKLWLIGFLGGDDDCNKLLQQFPSIDMDLDLQLHPITTSMGGKSFKSSLMKSFVPFGGFFPMPSELESSCSTSSAKPFKLCNSCNEKYEKEVSDVREGVSIDPAVDKNLVNLSSWLRIADGETSKRSRMIEAKEDDIVLDAKIMALQRKWEDICRRLHCARTNSLPKLHSSNTASFLHSVPLRKYTIDIGSRDYNLSHCEPSSSPKNSPPLSRAHVISASANAPAEIFVGLELNKFWDSSASQQNMSSLIRCTSSPSNFSITTDLTLGMHAAEECKSVPNSQHLNHSSDVKCSESPSQEKSLSQVSQSSYSSHYLEEQIFKKDIEQQWKALVEKIYWQREAIQTISRTLSSYRNRTQKNHHSNKGNVWLSFLGPDKVGKRKIAVSVAEIMFGGKDHFIFFDLNAQSLDNIDSIVDRYNSRNHRMKLGRKMLVDYLAEELGKHPHSVVLLENVEKADFLVRSSLSQAVKTGKFPDSHGRDICLNSSIFILDSSTMLKVGKDLLSDKVDIEFPEETILDAKFLQMRILVRFLDGNYCKNSITSVTVFPSHRVSNEHSAGKRKSINNESIEAEMSKRTCHWFGSVIDLNIPLEEEEGEYSDLDKSDGDDSEAWLGELLEHVHENVVFKAFDFDSVSQKILKQLKMVVGVINSLEIDRQVMNQILAAAWLAKGTIRETALEDWIKHVLLSSIEKAQRLGGERCDVVLKLVGVEAEACEMGVEGEATYLPHRIDVKLCDK